MNTAEKWHGTTIVLLRKNGETVVAGDGQVSLGNTVLKSKAKKVRKIDSAASLNWLAHSIGSILLFKVTTLLLLLWHERRQARAHSHTQCDKVGPTCNNLSEINDESKGT